MWWKLTLQKEIIALLKDLLQKIEELKMKLIKINFMERVFFLIIKTK